MKSIVKFYNPQKGMFTVLLENGEYSVIELLDSNEITIGDEIAGELEVAGTADIENITTGDTFSVIIQNIRCNEQQAINRTSLNNRQMENMELKELKTDSQLLTASFIRLNSKT